jgi:hypothetical protein
MTHPSSGGARGAELASGYISLSVKYTNAMKQIANDFSGIESQAAKTGEKAGAAMGTAISSGVAKNTRYAMDTAGIDMTSRANKIGAGIGYALSTAVGGGMRDIEKVGGAAFKGLEYVAMNSIKGISHGIRDLATGPIAQVIGATTVFGGLFATIEKGWKFDTLVQDTQTRLLSFGGTAQDVAGFMDSVNESLKNTANGFGDVAEVARSLFSEGLRGSGLTEELKSIQNVAAATGSSIEQITNLYEKAHGRDVVNPMVLGSLQMAGVPAREELQKALNVNNEQLDDLLKKGKVTFDTLWQQMTKDSEGAAERASKTWSGQFHKMGVNVAQIGGDALKALVGGGGGFDSINSQLEKLDGWINSHQQDIKNFFHEAAVAAHEIWDAVKGIIDFLRDMHVSIGDVVVAFVAWESIKGIAAVINAFSLIKGAISGAATLVTAFSEGALAKLGVNLGIVATQGAAATTAIEGLDGAAAATAAGGGLVALGGIIAGLAGGLAAIVYQFSKLPAFNDPKINYPWIQPSDLPARGPAATAPPGENPLLDEARRRYGNSPLPQTIPPSNSSVATVPRAEGSIQKSVSPYGLIQWAEPSTGGEAYIPLASSKRQRSLEIWRQTGKLLGMDDGGFGFFPEGNMGVDPSAPSGGRGGNVGKPGGWFTSPPNTRVWGKWKQGIMRGPRNAPRGPRWGFRDRDWPWWMFPGDDPSVGTPGPDRDHRRDIIIGPNWKHPTDHRLPSGGAYAPPAWFNSFDDGGITGTDKPGSATDVFINGKWYPQNAVELKPGGVGWQLKAVAPPNRTARMPASAGSGITPPRVGNFGAEGWRGTVESVIARYGPAAGIPPSQYGAWTNAIVTQINTESSGNPNAGNPNDPNGRGGTQNVQGLLQYLPSSYAASGGKLTGLPYMDPVGQIAGALFAPRTSSGGPAIGAPGGIGTPGKGWGPTGGAVASGYPSYNVGDTSSSGSYGGQTSPLSSQTGGVGGPTQSQQEAQDRKERNLNDRIVNLNGDIQVLEQRQSEQTDKTKQSEKDRIQNDIDSKRKELANAQSDMSQMQQDWNAKMSGGQTTGGGGGGGKGFDFGALADIGMKGITESLLPSGFINPMDSPILKGVGGVLKFLSGLGQKHGGPLGGITGGVLGLFGGIASGSPGAGINSLMQSFQSQPYGDITPGSPGSAPYTDPTQLFAGSGSVGIMPGQLPGMNSAFPQGSPASGTGGGALPGPASGQEPAANIFAPDFRGANFQGDPGGVKKTVDDQHLAWNRKHAMETQRHSTSGSGSG